MRRGAKRAPGGEDMSEEGKTPATTFHDDDDGHVFISSVRSSNVYPCLICIYNVYYTYIQTQQATFSNFSDSKVLKRTNMCYIFEKLGIKGYLI